MRDSPESCKVALVVGAVFPIPLLGSTATAVRTLVDLDIRVSSLLVSHGVVNPCRSCQCRELRQAPSGVGGNLQNDQQWQLCSRYMLHIRISHVTAQSPNQSHRRATWWSWQQLRLVKH